MPGTVYINPAVTADKRDAMAVAVNEALRIAMEDLRFSPKSELTAEQRKLLAGTAYAGDEAASRKTVIARVATFDSSVAPTPEQKEETLGFLNLLAEALGPQHPDAGLVGSLIEAQKAGGLPPREETPPGNIPAEAAPEAREIPAQEPVAGTTQDAAYAGNVDESVGLAAAVIRENEGFEPKAYWDDKGKKWTVGHGLTEHADGRAVRQGDVMTEDGSVRAVQGFIRRKLLPAAEANVPGWRTMDPRLRAAMLDTAYNAGPGYLGVKSPSMLKRLRSGEDPATVIAEENATWTKADGVTVQGLVNRRQKVKEKLIDWYVRDRDKAALGVVSR